MDRFDIDELVDMVLLQPRKERARSPVIGHPRILVPDRRGEELKEPPRGTVASAGNRPSGWTASFRLG
jgi:hypothetical protein